MQLEYVGGACSSWKVYDQYVCTNGIQYHEIAIAIPDCSCQTANTCITLASQPERKRRKDGETEHTTATATYLGNYGARAPSTSGPPSSSRSGAETSTNGAGTSSAPGNEPFSYITSSRTLCTPTMLLSHGIYSY